MTVRAFVGSAPQVAVRDTVWTGLLNGDTGQGQGIPHSADITVSVDGTFGAGGSIQWEGSNDGGVTYQILSDNQGVDAILPAGGMMTIQEQPKLIRPNVTAGDGTTSLVARMICRVRGQ